MTDKATERKICDIVKTLMEAEIGDTFKFDCYPDSIEHNLKAVDIKYIGVKSNLYMEHTKLQNFEYMIKEEKLLEQLIDTITNECAGRLMGPGRLELRFPLQSVNNIGDRKLLYTDLVKWIIQASLDSSNMKLTHPIKFISQLEHLGTKFQLYRSMCGKPGDIVVSRFAFEENDAADKQKITFDRALQAKCTKLANSKDKSTDHSVLILETNNDALDIEEYFFRAFNQFSKNTGTILPDTICTVQNYENSKFYHVCFLRKKGANIDYSNAHSIDMLKP